MKRLLQVVLLGTVPTIHGWLQSPYSQRQRPTAAATTTTTTAATTDQQHWPSGPTPNDHSTESRRSWLLQTVATTAAVFTTTTTTTIITTAWPAHALVKGMTPPPPKKVSDGKPTCTNMDDCQAQAEAKAAQRRAEQAAAQAEPTMKTPGGVRYRDLTEGTGQTVQNGDEVTLYYQVLKLGKRSFDGLSGEGTVVFSRGYGLEDDESKPFERSYITTVGSLSNIVALNQALVGMKVGGVRRLAILPQMGWRKPNASCEGGPGGRGTGGDIKTDFVVVPTAQMVAEEACFDTFKQPFPSTYAQQRRMAQRFDQSLIMEVQVVSAGPSTSGL